MDFGGRRANKRRGRVEDLVMANKRRGQFSWWLNVCDNIHANYFWDDMNFKYIKS